MDTNRTKTVLVTGASSGIGKRSVELLLEAGMKVYAASRRLERMRELEEKGAILLELDLREEQSISQAVEAIKSQSEGVDILVNNAGYGSYGAVEDVPIEEARQQFEVNLFGLARLTQLLLPSMRTKGSGRIINISSMGGKMYTPFGAWYHATKHALEGFSDVLRLELSAFGIDVVIVEPGGIKTEWGRIAADNLEASSSGGAYARGARTAARSMRELYGSQRLTDPERIAQVILKAATARRPKTRYVAGFMARPALFLRKLLPDRAFDRIISKMA